MDLEIIILSEVSQTKINDITFMWNLKYDTNELIYRADRLTDTENKHTKGEAGGGINWEYGINRCTLPYIKQIHNKFLLYSTGNYSQYLVITYKGKESEVVVMSVSLREKPLMWQGGRKVPLK